MIPLPRERNDVIIQTIRKVVEQGAQSSRRDSLGSNTCAYRSGRGGKLKCAVGHWLPDHIVTPHTNSMSVSELTLHLTCVPEVPDAPELLRWVKENYGLLESLQAFHDNDYHWIRPDNMWEGINDLSDQLHFTIPADWTLRWVESHWKKRRARK